MTDTYHMINITQDEFEQLVGQNTGSICEAKQTMIRENSPQTHRPGMQNRLVT